MRSDLACIDCGARVDDEYYVVLDSVWRDEAMLGARDGQACVECLERRIGRKLQARDFADVPANRLAFWREVNRYPSVRLADRMRRT